MTPEEKLVAELKEAIEKKGYSTAEDVTKAIDEALKSYKPAEIEAAKQEIETLKSAMIKQGEEMERLKNSNPVNEKLMSLKAGIRKALAGLVEGKSEAEIREMAKKGELTITVVKAADTMLISTNVTGNNVGRVAVSPNWDYAPMRMPFIRDFIRATGTNSPTSRVVEASNDDGDAAWTAEGALKPLIDFDLKTTDYTAKEVSVAVEVSEKMLYDIDKLMAYIEKKIINKVDLKEEDGILNGSGSGNDPVGITNVASAFTLVGIETENPNNMDAIIAAYTQLLSLEYQPNVCFLNPIDWANTKMKKDKDGQYVINLPGQVIDGLPIIPKNKIPVGYFLIGDANQAMLEDYKALVIEPGYTGDNFRKGIITLRGIKEIIFYVPTNQHNAFVYDQFSVVKEAIAVETA